VFVVVVILTPEIVPRTPRASGITIGIGNIIEHESTEQTGGQRSVSSSFDLASGASDHFARIYKKR
jgi:hypothetical protein